MKTKYIKTETLLEYLNEQSLDGLTHISIGELTKFIFRNSTSNVESKVISSWIQDRNSPYLIYCQNCRSLGHETDEYCHECGAKMINYRPKWIIVRSRNETHTVLQQ